MYYVSDGKAYLKVSDTAYREIGITVTEEVVSTTRINGVTVELGDSVLATLDESEPASLEDLIARFAVSAANPLEYEDIVLFEAVADGECTFADTKTFEITSDPADATLTVASETESVATAAIADGVVTVTAVALGTTKITVTGEKTDFTTGTVEFNVEVVEAESSITAIDDQTCSATGTKDVTVVSDPVTMVITVASSDDTVATVAVADHTVTITGHAAGTATITVSGELTGYADAEETFDVVVS